MRHYETQVLLLNPPDKLVSTYSTEEKTHCIVIDTANTTVAENGNLAPLMIHVYREIVTRTIYI